MPIKPKQRKIAKKLGAPGFFDGIGYMRNFKGSILIRASKETIWSCLTTMDRLTSWFTGVAAVKATENYADVGSVLTLTYNLPEGEFEATNTVIESRAGEVLQCQLSGLMTGSMNYALIETADGIRLEFALDYRLSDAASNTVAEPIFHLSNVENAKHSLTKLKKLAEQAM
jgi:carbon monoxide dehydrogenase subunit G